ncbi:DrmB family protein [Rhodococcus sp. NPDC019627]|uniref:MrfA-like Zn-binding domain-containing protein n=2 Tax=Rhodococcus TaxID=1827 RepID=C1BDH1_RHOOB|nr:DUF1998 domain-containing protein [Rhodococcus opacus]BAH47024.1 hypothetical protein ROP_pROB02-00110 [Rhodococcus opacus B4]
MSTGNMRRSQLVSPFGVGALSILVNGSSVITAGLDHWYESDDRDNLYPDEFLVPEWRLQERLRVSELRLPPDFRRPRGGGNEQRNLKLSVPVLRFPRWCFCIYCKRLSRTKLSMTQLVRCTDNTHDERRRPVMSQVPFIVICERGHLDDFPFPEWVHHSLSPTCHGTLRLLSQGGGTLAGQLVKCDGCKAQRSLEGITQTAAKRGDEERTILSSHLAAGAEFNCVGSRPWVADEGSGCGLPLRGALRAAGNVYFPKVESSIYLPRHEGGVSAEVLELLRRPDVQARITAIHEIVGQVTTDSLRKTTPLELLKSFSDDELAAGLDELLGNSQKTDRPSETETLTSTVTWRYPEFKLLRETPNDPDLKASDPGVPDRLVEVLDRVRRVEVLRETRALRGFTRVRDGLLRLSEGKAMLRRTALPPDHDWLPACVVKGEGLYLELNSQALSDWENRDEVRVRARRISTHYVASRHGTDGPVRDLSPRLILLHTLAHLLINELVFTCGYSSAALRERLYVSGEPGREMAGVLIYTAAGDSEGTMGGLVRMARPENLGPVFEATIDKARWCSTDPVCMEVGELGQGPESCNLAACHGCALLPETSCEEFNRFLDRGLVIGTFADPTLGFFARP